MMYSRSGNSSVRARSSMAAPRQARARDCHARHAAAEITAETGR